MYRQRIPPAWYLLWLGPLYRTRHLKSLRFPYRQRMPPTWYLPRLGSPCRIRTTLQLKRQKRQPLTRGLGRLHLMLARLRETLSQPACQAEGRGQIPTFRGKHPCLSRAQRQTQTKPARKWHRARDPSSNQHSNTIRRLPSSPLLKFPIVSPRLGLVFVTQQSRRGPKTQSE